MNSFMSIWLRFGRQNSRNMYVMVAFGQTSSGMTRGDAMKAGVLAMIRTQQ
jgi:hypothetical protein